MAAKKTGEQSFTTDWNRTASWAQASGIPSTAYLPVYQLDVQRLLAPGSNVMSAAERHVAVLAAQNPNNVPSAPTDNPQPSNVFGNARHDLGMIATGLEPQHLVTGIFDTVKNTVEAIQDPQREEGKNLGLTAANWLQNTLLSFVPGAYDIGTVLRADPNLSGSEGFEALADHPLVSLLDLMPLDSGGLLAKTGIGDRLASAGGMTTEQLAAGSASSAVVKALANRTWFLNGEKGIKLSDPSAGLQDMTIGDKLQTWASNSKLGASKPIQGLLRAYVSGNQFYSGVNDALITPMMSSLESLDTDEMAQYNGIFEANRKGQNMQDLLADPKVSLKVKDAVDQTISVIKFQTEEAIAASDVIGVRRLDGSIGLYASVGKRSEKVVAARDLRNLNRKSFVGQLNSMDPLVKSVTELDAAVPRLADDLEQKNLAARNAIPNDESLLHNITTEEKLNVGKRSEAADKLFGPSGLVDQLTQAMRKGDDDQMQALLPVLNSRLSKWGYKSVDATAEDANPAFQAVAAQMETLDTLFKNRQKMNDSIDNRIMGEGALTVREKAEDKARAAEEKRELADKHTDERMLAKDNKRRALRQNEDARNLKLKNLKDLRDRMRDAAVARGGNAQALARKDLTPEIRAEVDRLDAKWKDSVLKTNAIYDKKALELKLEAEKQVAPMAERHAQEDKDLAEDLAARKEMHGHFTDSMQLYVDSVKDFHKAVWENPTDDMVGLEVQTYTKKLMEHERSAELLDATEKMLKDRSVWSESRVQALHENPDLLKELVWQTTRDIYEHPDNWDADLVDAAKQAYEEVRQSGLDEVNTLIAEGYKPQWIPHAGTFDRPTSTVRALVGKGEPHVDVAHERVHDLTATRHDVALGVTKAMGQALRRDGWIDLVNHTLEPLVVTDDTLLPQIRSLPGFEDIDTSVGTHLDAYSAKIAKLGLTKFDSEKLFGFTPPRWTGKNTYLPTSMVKALEKTQELEGKGEKGLFDKSNSLFRYSILGLSPRYTAHILFGGTFLLALRSTPYMPTMLLRAAKALRDGDMSVRELGRPTQEGYSRFGYAVSEHGFASGKQLSNLAIGEHIEKTQGVLLSKASPFHYLKAAADLNFRFTRYITSMQKSVAYFDHLAKAERRGTFVDDLTGKKVPMTLERAQREAEAHVLKVFGDLRSMAPLERQIARSIMPFYGWTRHILKYVLTYPADHPFRAMVLALTAFENSEAVPKGLPERIQFLFFLGAPDSQGNVTAIDTRFLDPLRDVANYATLGGWLQGLNPAILAPLAMMDPQLVYGSTQLYPNLTYNDMYGIETAGAQGNAISGLEQFVPQLGAVGPLASAITKAGKVRQLASNPNAFYKSIFEDLNIPFAQVQKVNVKQIAATDAIARYQVAKSAAANAFQSGDFSSLSGYKTVPYPLNPDYEVTPEQLQQIYNQAMAEYPGQQPQNVLLPPPTPANY